MSKYFKRKVNGTFTESYKTIIKKTINAIKIINFSLFTNRKKDLFLNNEDPHFEQTIFPPKDLSEIKDWLPHLIQILLPFIILINHFIQIIFSK